jgi:hypothetical protein
LDNTTFSGFNLPELIALALPLTSFRDNGSENLPAGIYSADRSTMSRFPRWSFNTRQGKKIPNMLLT